MHLRTKRYGSIPTGSLEPPLRGRRMQARYAEIAILSQYLVPSRAVNAKCNTLSRDGPWRVDDTITGKWRCLLIAGDNYEVHVTSSINVTPKTTE